MTTTKRISTAQKALTTGTLRPLRVWLPATIDVATFRTQFRDWVAAEHVTFEVGQGQFLEDECLHLFSTLALTAYQTIYRSKRSSDTFQDGTKAVTKLTGNGYTGISRKRLRQQFSNNYGKYLEFLRTYGYLEVYHFYDMEGLASDGTDILSPAPTKRNYGYKQKGHKRANTGSYIGTKAGSKEEGHPKQYRLPNTHALETAIGFDAIYPVELGAKYSYKAHKYYTKKKAQILTKRAGHSAHRQRLAEHVDTLLRNVDYAGMEAWLRTTSEEVNEMSHVWSLYYADQLRQGIAQFENLCDDFGHRCHTPLTNMATPLRRFYRPNGNQVYSLDIRCSQFVLASYLFEYPEQCFKLLTENGDMDAATVRYVLDTLHAAYQADEKVRRFCYDARHTDLYATTVTELGLSSRPAGKDLWFGAFFSATGEFEGVKRQLSPLYGSLLAVTSGLNDPLPGSTVKRNLMPMILQLLEQRLLIEGVARRLTETYDGEFACIHDSIHTELAGIPRAAENYKEEFAAASLPMPPYQIETTDDTGIETKRLMEFAADGTLMATEHTTATAVPVPKPARVKAKKAVPAPPLTKEAAFAEVLAYHVEALAEDEDHVVPLRFRPYLNGGTTPVASQEVSASSNRSSSEASEALAVVATPEVVQVTEMIELKSVCFDWLGEGSDDVFTDAEDFLVAPGEPTSELLLEVKPTQPEPARVKKRGLSLHEWLFDGEPAPKVYTDRYERQSA